MDGLEAIRREIDEIDKQLVGLFEKRMEQVQKVAEYKKKHNLPIFNATREDEVIEKNMKYIKNKDIEVYAKLFLEELMSISRSMQKNLLWEDNVNSSIKNDEKNFVVGFQGEYGSFSEEATKKYFGEDVTTKNLPEFEDVFVALENKSIDFGVLPIENSSAGSVTDVYDLLRKYGFYIVGEHCIKISHNLLGVKGAKMEDIKEVYSHPQALSQSRNFLKQHPEWRLIPYSNTAASAKMIAQENCKYKAAIGSKNAAKLYDLDILATDIQYNKNNYTRFIIISREPKIDKQCNKISILISLMHKPGALYTILQYFKEHNLNMLKIESRPILERPWEYYFYIDFEGNMMENSIKEFMEKMKRNCVDFKLLGNYKAY